MIYQISNQNLIIMLISIELILLGIGILFLIYSYILDDVLGLNMTLLLLPLAGCESALILGIIIKYYPIRGDIIIHQPSY